MNISRENGRKLLAIGVFIHDRDMGSVVSDFKARFEDKVKLPEGYSVTWSGEFENQERAMARLSVIVPISVLVIFLLLFDAFKSFRNSLLIIMNIPFALIGGILALVIGRFNLSVSASVGFIALFGVAVLNGVVIHLGTDTDPNSSYLLDLTPQTDSWDDPALVLGQSFTDANAGIIITPVSMNGSSASVQVTVTPLPCVRANPTVTVSPRRKISSIRCET
jgi:hypothetical protein